VGVGSRWLSQTRFASSGVTEVRDLFLRTVIDGLPV
jgi:hypothetical protein